MSASAINSDYVKKRTDTLRAHNRRFFFIFYFFLQVVKPRQRDIWMGLIGFRCTVQRSDAHVKQPEGFFLEIILKKTKEMTKEMIPILMF